MTFDLLYLIIIALAAWTGFRKGFVVGIFSLVAVIVGLAAAMKLSVVMAGYIGTAVKVSDEWLPVISFLVVFIAVLILIRLGAKAIEKGLQLVMLGWLNRLGGILLFAMLVTEIISLFVKLRNKLFYAYFEEKSIVFFDDGVKRIYSSHIKEIEYRYNIFYLTLKNDQVRMIETERVEGEEAQKDFVQEFVFWAKTYNLPFTEEAREKLGITL
jgi:membrane protein required for colicin V production